jgi:hypothetical protein
VRAGTQIASPDACNDDKSRVLSSQNENTPDRTRSIGSRDWTYVDLQASPSEQAIFRRAHLNRPFSSRFTMLYRVAFCQGP